MNSFLDNLDDMMQSAGFNSNAFQHTPTMSATTDPHAIRQAVSQPNTVYAAIEENPDPIPVSMPEVVTVEDTVENAITEEIHDDNPQHDQEFTEEDWNGILEDAGFHSDIETEDIESQREIGNALDEENENDEEDNEEQTEQQVIITPQGLVPVINDDNTENSSSGSETEDSNLLPANSPTLLIDDSTSRFSGAEWYNEIQKAVIIIAGLGGIGSNLAFQIARMHPASLFLYDDDNVEIGNMSGQLFSREDVDRNKANAIASMITKYTSMSNPVAINYKFTDSTEAYDIMMCGFDSMSARKVFFKAWKKHVINKEDDVKRRKCLFLDGRLSIDTLQVFAITGDDHYNIDRYENEYLFNDSEADETICSLKQTTYLACMIASVMTNLFTNFTANLLNPAIPYDLPFFTEYDAQSMLFKTEN